MYLLVGRDCARHVYVTYYCTYYVPNSDIFIMSFVLFQPRASNKIILRDIITNRKAYIRRCYFVAMPYLADMLLQ